MEWSPPLHLGVEAIEKGAFGSPSTKVANFILLYLQCLWQERKNSLRHNLFGDKIIENCLKIEAAH